MDYVVVERPQEHDGLSISDQALRLPDYNVILHYISNVAWICPKEAVDGGHDFLGARLHSLLPRLEIFL